MAGLSDNAHENVFQHLKCAGDRFERLLKTIENGTLDNFVELLNICREATAADAITDVLRSNVTGRGVNLLHVAALKGRDDIIDLIIQKTGKELLTTDQDGNTAFHCAARSSSLTTVQKIQDLLDPHAVYCPNKKCITPLQYSLHSNDEKLPIYLLDNAEWTETLSKSSPEGSILQWAVLSGNLEIAKKVIGLSPRNDIIDQHVNPSLQSEIPPALVLAGSMSDTYCLGICQFLQEKNALELCARTKDAQGCTVVHNAAEAGNLRSIKYLAEKLPSETMRQICTEKGSPNPLEIRNMSEQIKGVLVQFCVECSKTADASSYAALPSRPTEEKTNATIITGEQETKANALRALASDATKGGRFDRALELYKEIIELLKYEKGTQYAEERISQLITTTFSNIAYVELKLNKIINAKAAAQHAIDIDNKWFKGYYRLAMCFAAENDYEEATQQMYQALLRSGSNPDVQKAFNEYLRKAQAQHRSSRSNQ